MRSNFDGGKLTISSTVTDGVVSVSIKDSGIGMTAEQMWHIFNKFYQADTSHATKGNGLGPFVSAPPYTV